MNKSLSFIHLVECECGEVQTHTCPKCGHSFGEDNSQHVLHDAQMDEPPYVPDDKNTSGQVSDEVSPRRTIQDLLSIRYPK
jgi:hypothetical protein